MPGKFGNEEKGKEKVSVATAQDRVGGEASRNSASPN
jgi:hypothetical protein